MEKSDKLVAYGICILALSAVVMTWISHSGRAARKAEPPKAVGVPWTSSSQAAVPTTTQDSPSQTSVPSNPPAEGQHSYAPPVYQPSRPQSDAPPASQSLLPDLSTPSDEEVSPPDSEQNPSKETASQRVGRRLRRH
jgi:hypothetical protein